MFAPLITFFSFLVIFSLVAIPLQSVEIINLVLLLDVLLLSCFFLNSSIYPLTPLMILTVAAADAVIGLSLLVSLTRSSGKSGSHSFLLF